jgi:hypothetical protein
MATNYKKEADIHFAARVKLHAEIERLRAALEPFATVAERLGWDKLSDQDPTLHDHVVEAPADDIAPGAVYCLAIGAFKEAKRALEQNDNG